MTVNEARERYEAAKAAVIEKEAAEERVVEERKR